MARRPRPRRRSEISPAAIVAIILLIAVIVGLAGTYIYFRVKAEQAVELDPDTFCPVTGPVSTTAVLLDLSDPVAKPTLDDIRNRFETLMTEVPEGGQLIIFALTKRTSELEERVSVCNPGDGENVDPMIAAPRLAKQRWEESYRRPLDDFIEGLSNDASASRSPIMAGIQQIELKLFNSARATKGAKRLIVISDMLEHTDAYSHYRDGASFPRYEEGPARDMFRSSLQQVDATVLLIQRLNTPVAPLDLANFWAAWFNANKVADVNIVRLAGAK